MKAGEKYFEFKDLYGRVWGVPYQAVVDDYVEDQSTYYKVPKDKVNVDKEAVLTWWHEQISWHEVKRDGVLLKDLSMEQKAKLWEKGATAACAERYDCVGARVKYKIKKFKEKQNG